MPAGIEETDAADPCEAGEVARRTLALRIAHRNRLRAERLARLHADGPPAAAAGRTAASTPPEAASSVPKPATIGRAAPASQPRPVASPPEPSRAAAPLSEEDEEEAALEEFLRALSASAPPAAGAAPAPAVSKASAAEPAAVLRFQRPPDSGAPGPNAGLMGMTEPRAAPICDLHRLEGAGPGLIWALQRAGIACLAELAELEAPDLSNRLGALGGLVPARDWIEAARREIRAPDPVRG
ncbi:MAG: hypothetical protein KDK03_04310 [Rhodobacteraceae bacterium]|uniref:hypothetical protein n=1 Tax=Amaricoccus sp. B4 TaxID=3368557 RepID=UPI0013A70193|nr:hypothetical protein [Paracoccaceae bacterium]